MSRSWNRRMAREFLSKSLAQLDDEDRRVERLPDEYESPVEKYFVDAIIDAELNWKDDPGEYDERMLKRAIRIARKLKWYPISEERRKVFLVRKRMGIPFGIFEVYGKPVRLEIAIVEKADLR